MLVPTLTRSHSTGDDANDFIYESICHPEDLELVRSHLDSGVLVKMLDKYESKLLSNSKKEQHKAMMEMREPGYIFMILGARAMTCGCKIPKTYKTTMQKVYMCVDLPKGELMSRVLFGSRVAVAMECLSATATTGAHAQLTLPRRLFLSWRFARSPPLIRFLSTFRCHPADEEGAQRAQRIQRWRAIRLRQPRARRNCESGSRSRAEPWRLPALERLGPGHSILPTTERGHQGPRRAKDGQSQRDQVWQRCLWGMWRQGERGWWSIARLRPVQGSPVLW